MYEKHKTEYNENFIIRGNNFVKVLVSYVLPFLRKNFSLELLHLLSKVIFCHNYLKIIRSALIVVLYTLVMNNY